MKRWICSLFLIYCLMGCSSHPNNSLRRQRYAFNTRYNIYYNARQIFETQLKQTELTATDSIHMSEKPFDEVIEKCRKAIQLYSVREKPQKKPGWKKNPKQRAFQNRTEYNPFLVNCWLLMGKAYFYNKDYDRAAETFSYTARHFKEEKDKYIEALLWEANSHMQQRNVFLTEHLLRSIERKQLCKKDKKLYDRLQVFTNSFSYHLPEENIKDTVSVKPVRNIHLSFSKQDSLYGDVYMAYQNKELEKVKSKCEEFYLLFPEDLYTPLFLYLNAFSFIPDHDERTFRSKLTEITSVYPFSPLAELAQTTLSLLEDGRKLNGEYIFLPDIYDKLISQNHNTEYTLHEEKELPHSILILYSSLEKTDQELIFDISSFNFTYLLEKQLDTEIRWGNNTRLIVIKGFSNKKEAEVYQKRIKTLPSLFGLNQESEILVHPEK